MNFISDQFREEIIYFNFIWVSTYSAEYSFLYELKKLSDSSYLSGKTWLNIVIFQSQVKGIFARPFANFWSTSFTCFTLAYFQLRRELFKRGVFLHTLRRPKRPNIKIYPPVTRPCSEAGRYKFMPVTILNTQAYFIFVQAVWAKHMIFCRLERKISRLIVWSTFFRPRFNNKHKGDSMEMSLKNKLKL